VVVTGAVRAGEKIRTISILECPRLARSDHSNRNYQGWPARAALTLTLNVVLSCSLVCSWSLRLFTRFGVPEPLLQPFGNFDVVVDCVSRNRTKRMR
jgi:hypothetical protein